MINKIIGKRNWSAQEVSYVQFGLLLYSSIRDEIQFDYRCEYEIRELVDLAEDGREPGRSVLDKYKVRPGEFSYTILFEFLTLFRYNGRSTRNYI